METNEQWPEINNNNKNINEAKIDDTGWTYQK